MKRVSFILVSLLLLLRANGGEVWKNNNRLTEADSVDLLASAIGDNIPGQPLADAEFRHFRDGEFYELVCKANEKLLGRSLTETEKKKLSVKINFQGVSFVDVAVFWLVIPKSVFDGCRLEDATFWQCDLSESHFQRTEFIRGWFVECNLAGASFNGEDNGAAKDIRHTERRSKKSSDISFYDSNLNDCDFRYSFMSYIAFTRSLLNRVDLSWARFDSISYDPIPASLPFLPSFASFTGLPNFSYDQSPTGIAELRNAFKNDGLRSEERQITTALCRKQVKDGGWAEGKCKWLLFDLTTAFGMFPGRALRILFCLCGLFALPYTWAILRRTRNKEAMDVVTGEGRIWQVPLDRRLLGGDAKPRLLHVDLREDGRLRGIIRALRWGVFFSLISAFSVGYRDLDVGRWIERINPDESTMRASGWLRTVSGLQGLMSFYLLALWLLTYVGRPFE